MVFLCKASIVILVLLAFYKLFLEGESFFTANRFYLLACLLLTFILPFIALPKWVDHQGVVGTWLEETSFQEPSRHIDKPIEAQPIDYTSKSDIADKENVSVTPPTAGNRGIGFWLLAIYIFGVAVFSGHLFFQLLSIFKTILRAKDRVEDIDFTLINVIDDSGPRSFFNYIFINPEKYDAETYEQILEHEKTHAKQKHSIDLLFAETAIIVLWFNPFVWWFKKEVEKNMEYQTDAMLLKSPVVEPENYQLNLLEIGVERKPLTIVSNYNQSLIKKRILMMNKKKSNGHSYWNYAFITPTLLVTLLVLNRPFAVNGQEQVVSVYSSDAVDEYDDDDFDNDLTPLLQAAWRGDFELVKKLVAEGADINYLQEGEGTALMVAIERREFGIAKFLLQEGADPNLGSDSDGHPLWLAAKNGNIELVRLLVKKGADVNTKFPGDGSALIQACKMGNLNMVKALVELKADINMPVRGDGNPLIMASKGNYLEIVEYLVELGANINQEVLGDETPLISASEQGHLRVVKYLVNKGADVNKICREERYDGKIRVRTALKMAEKNGHDAVIAYLKSKGATN
ncbi:MAG: ankyrin repeat domain-containing protein [Bacteroidota bacterium]